MPHSKYMFITLLALALIGAPAVALAADQPAPAKAAKADKAAKPSKNLLLTIDSDPEFQDFYHLLHAAGVAKTLHESGKVYTVFVPDEAAIARYGKTALTELLKPKNKIALRDLVLRHIVPGRLVLADFAGKKLTQSTLGGGVLELDGQNPERLTVSGITLEPIARSASNGLLYRLDAVLPPLAATGKSLPLAH